MTSPVLDFLLKRSSAPIQDLRAPAPGDSEIATIIAAASRVHDHGRLAPWRFIVYRGEAREEIGASWPLLPRSARDRCRETAATRNWRGSRARRWSLA